MNIKSITSSEKIELAKAYVALSNAHKLAFVFQMFSDEASYHSSSVGMFEGRDEIENMMTDFFTRFSDVFWKTWDYRCIDNACVHFEFEMTATAVDTKEKIKRTGYEEIEFTNAGLISRLEVQVL